MKLENLPKIFAASVLIVSFTVFRHDPFKAFSKEFLSWVVGLRERSGSLKARDITRLPVTSNVAYASSFTKTVVPLSIFEEPGITVAPAPPDIDPQTLPFLSSEFDQFVASVTNGDADTVRGIYVEGVLANAVVQQPQNNWAFVSEDSSVITEFQSAHQHGTTGLLAHNFLLGREFYKLKVGQVVGVVYGDGSLKRYEISSISQFQKLNTSSLTSDMIDLSTGKKLSSTDIFNRFYNAGDQVTFQTCLERDGNSSWGLTFIEAKPIH